MYNFKQKKDEKRAMVKKEKAAKELESLHQDKEIQVDTSYDLGLSEEDQISE